MDIPEYMDGEATYLVTVLPRDDNRIILMIVEPSSEGNLAKVTMLLPNHLAGIEAYANDIKVDALELETGKGVVFDLTEKVSAKEVAFTFQSGGGTLATCTITTDNLLSPEGDCMW